MSIASDTGACRSLCYAPIYPIHADIADNISFKLNAFMFLLPISAGLAIVFRATLPPHSEGIGGICASAAVGVHRALFGGMDTGDRSVLDDAGKCHQPDVLCRSVVSLRAGCAAVLLPFRWTIGFPAKLLPG